jgi:hypothetical protein
LAVIGALYVATIPWTINSYAKLKRAYEAAGASVEAQHTTAAPADESTRP